MDSSNDTPPSQKIGAPGNNNDTFSLASAAGGLEKEKPPPITLCPPRPILDKNQQPHYQVVRLCQPKYLKNPEGEMEWLWWYYVHKKFSSSSFFPPPPYDPYNDVLPPLIDLARAKKNDISGFLYKPPTDSTYSLGIQDVVKEVVEEVVDTVDKVPSMHNRSVSDFVFTAEKPIHLLMSDKNGKENNLIRKASELGIYKKKMKRTEIALALEKYWVKQCVTYEKYMESPIFAQEKQEICRERKDHNAKRNNEFADSQTDTKKPPGRNRKAIMTSQAKDSYI